MATLFQIDQEAPAHNALSGHKRERYEEPDLVRSVDLCADRNYQKGVATEGLALHLPKDSLGMHVRENRAPMRVVAE